jgi:hypothetical protein
MQIFDYSSNGSKFGDRSDPTSMDLSWLVVDSISFSVVYNRLRQSVLICQPRAWKMLFRV